MKRFRGARGRPKPTGSTRSNVVVLDGASLSIEDIRRIIANDSVRVAISSQAMKRITRSHRFLLVEAVKNPIYGVNTGFGPMVKYIIGADHLSELQLNLIRGHAVGAGEPIRAENVLASMIVRLNSLVKGYSGVSSALIETLAKLINRRVTPIVPEHGAVGTSGDLVQLAHIAQGLVGEGEVVHKGKRRRAQDVLRELNIRPHVLGPKEGLSLINGTSVMTGIASRIVPDAERLESLAIRSGALALELVRGVNDLLDPTLYKVRPHAGQQKVAGLLRELLADSTLLSDRRTRGAGIIVKETTHVADVYLQDVYSFRCIPQILGPLHETLRRTHSVVTIEMNSVTDNPIVDVASKRFLHGGNFHGEYIASALDQLKASLVKLGMLSERRINFFLHRALNRTFPPFLNLKEPGLTMGLQGLQFVATSTAAHSQSLAFPHAVHSIPTNGDNQDVVSMGTDAALIAQKVVDNVFVILSIELITLAQAVDALAVEKKLSSNSRKLYRKVRAFVPTIYEDRSLTPELQKLSAALRTDHELSF